MTLSVVDAAVIEDVADVAPVSYINLVLLGGPGSGKGTQAEQLKNKLGLLHVATGDLFRMNLKNNTELGQLARTYMDRGELVPDDVTAAMVRDRLGQPDAQAGFLLDGFPRTLPQAAALAEILMDMERELSMVLYIKVSDEEIISRLSGRRVCRECQTPYHVKFNPPAQEGVCDRCGGELYQRADDNPATIRARLETYHEQTAPLIEYYQQIGVLRAIDGEGEVSEITTNVLAAVQELIKPKTALKMSYA